MTTIEDRLKELGDTGDKIIGYAIVDSMLNIMSEALDELEDEELSNALEKIQKTISDRQKELMNIDIKCD